MLHIRASYYQPRKVALVRDDMDPDQIVARPLTQRFWWADLIFESVLRMQRLDDEAKRWHVRRRPFIRPYRPITFAVVWRWYYFRCDHLVAIAAIHYVTKARVQQFLEFFGCSLFWQHFPSQEVL